LVVSCLLIACKDPFGEETKAKIELSMKLASVEGLDGAVKIDEGFLRTSNLTITNDSDDDGRETATTEIPSDQPPFILHGSDPNQPIIFKLSKGLSNRMQLTMTLSLNRDNIIAGNGIPQDSVDLTSYFADAVPSLLFTGIVASTGGEKKLVVAIDSIAQLTFIGSSDGPWGEGSFDKSILIEENNKATVFFNANLLFSSVTTGMIDSAKFQHHDGVPTIFIHRQHNRNIYKAITTNMMAPGHVLIRSNQ
jgi:hypothetical protein